MFFQEKSSFLMSAPFTVIPVSTDLPERKKHARYGLITFFALLIPLSALCQLWTILSADMLSGFFLMWTPAIATLVTRLVRREDFLDISFRFEGKKMPEALLSAFLVPALVGLTAYGLAWTAGVTSLVHFHASSSLSGFLSFFHVTALLPLRLVGTLLFLTVISAISATGEEIGWRGYMLTRLIDAGIPNPILISGLIWSLWHWPLLLLASHGPFVFIKAIIFLITITSLGCVSARLRLKTGSLWPSIVLHAAWNSIILDIFDSFSKDTHVLSWTGEAGILVALIMIIVAYIFCSRGERDQNLNHIS